MVPGEDFGEVNNVRGEEILSEIGDPQRDSSTALIVAVWLNSFGLIAKYRRGAAVFPGISDRSGDGGENAAERKLVSLARNGKRGSQLLFGGVIFPNPGSQKRGHQSGIPYIFPGGVLVSGSQRKVVLNKVCCPAEGPLC